MKNRKIISIILLSALLVSAASCGESVDSGVSDTTAVPAEETTAEAAYPHETQDFSGYTFKVMNLDKQYGCHIRLDFDEQTGEALDDAIYNRNRRVEEQLNFVLEEVIIPGGATWGTGQTGACDTLVSSVMAGDNAYDAAYVPLNFKTSIVTDGYVMNLLDIPELHLYEEYWDSVVNQEITAGDALYTASGPFNLMTLDLSWVLLFNKEVMDIQKMEYPYQLVRDGKWTLDRMYEYVSQAANLNGDESFAYSESGSSLYGIVASTSDPMAYMTAADVHLY